MNSLEREFNIAVSTTKISGTILAAANKDGSFNYLKPFGNIGLENNSLPVSLMSTMCLASCTKLVTSVATMQCVERGLIGLDDEISTWLPEWKNPLILKGFGADNEQKPIFEKAKNPILLKHLLSHTSGITGFENEDIMKYYGSLGHVRATLIWRSFVSEDEEVRKGAVEDVRKEMGIILAEPLLFEPGNNWEYGQGVDWAGQLESTALFSTGIERLTNLTLEQYCQENIFKPLGMKNTTYRLLDHPHVATNLLKMTSRKTDGTLEHIDSIYPVNPDVDMGGCNLYTSAPDFLEFLKSLLCDDGRVIRPETADVMFGYRLPDSPAFTNFREDSAEYHLGQLAPNGATVDHCLAGLVNNEDLVGGRKAKSVTWSGATHCYWWIDKKAGICGFYGSQLLGIRDQGISKAMFEKFERAVYEEYEMRSVE